MKKINSICIIDDDSITVFGIRKMLDKVVDCGNINDYRNGQVAMQALTTAFEEYQEIPEIIFLDINMPIMDGWQFLKAFLALPLPISVHINILTSSIDPYDHEQFEFYKNKTKHTLTYTSKPVRPENIKNITNIENLAP